MVIDHFTPSNDYSLIRLTYDATQDLAAETNDLKKGDTIENDDLTVAFTGFDEA